MRLVFELGCFDAATDSVMPQPGQPAFDRSSQLHDEQRRGLHAGVYVPTYGRVPASARGSEAPAVARERSQVFLDGHGV